jgi:CelD/BcsL family acetyltransferase involved in cellulose biosynthesis
MPDILVEIASAPIDVGEAWSSLVASADGNVFLDPAALNPVFETGFADMVVMLAWADSDASRQLVGVWALERRRLTPIGPAVLAGPAYDYAFVASPVADPAHANAVMAAFLERIAADRSLPKVLRLKYLDAGSAASVALVRAMAARRDAVRILADRQRPYVTQAEGQKLSGSTRKKLRQDWNRLAALGETAVSNDRELEKVSAAFETFLALEAAGWKGEEGTAILSSRRDAEFARRFIASLAREGKASVALLGCDGRPVAAQVLLYCGTRAYTWKTAFDAAFAKFSPGALLVDKVSTDLLAGPFEAIESCSPEGGFMNQIWSGRRQTLDLLVDVGGTPSLAFRSALLREAGRAELKGLRDRLRAVKWPARPTPARKAS